MTTYELVGADVDNGFVLQPNVQAALDAKYLNDLVIDAMRDHGAVGDGTTDDTAALVATKNATPTTGGAKAYLPKGTYLCSGLVLDKAGQRWELAEGAVIKAINSITGNLITITGAGVVFTGGKVDGNLSGQTVDRDGIVVSAANVTIQSVEATNCRGNGIALAAAAVGCYIAGNYSHNNGISTNAAAGIQVVDGTLNRIIGNRCESNGVVVMGGANDGDGIRLQGTTGTGHNVVAGNVCRNNARRGIKLQQGFATITGNECTGNGVAGIGVTNSTNPQYTPSVISSNTLIGNYRGWQLDTCQNLIVSDNLTADSVDYGLLANTSANQITFSGNVIARSQRYGANIQGCQDWTITGNQIIDNGQGATNTYGLALTDDTGATSCKRINITGNTSHNSGSNTTQTRGFDIGGTAPDRITIVGNNVSNGVTSGINIVGSATNTFQWANSGYLTNNQDAPWSSFYMASGAFIGGTTTGGLTILNSAAYKLGFWGKAPVIQPAAVTAAPTQTGSYVQADVQAIATSLNDLITKLKAIGITA